VARRPGRGSDLDRSDIGPLVALVALVVLAAVITWREGALGVARNDDWSYHRALEHWVGTGQLIGAATGSAVAGFLIDGAGPGGAFWAAAAFLLVGTIVAVTCVRWFPDLRGRDPSPIPDTEPVPVTSP